MTCPWCGSSNLICDEAEVGVGTIHGPYACEDCHAYQPGDDLLEKYLENGNGTPEVRGGFFRGDC